MIITIRKRNHILAAKSYKNYVSNKYYTIFYSQCEFECFTENENNKIYGCVLIINKKKNCKTSVKRNLLKRRIKEILKSTPLYKSLVIISKPLAFVDNYLNVKNALLHLINLIKNK